MWVFKTFTPDDDRFLTLVGHEGLHAWIPQRLGAPSSNPADYWFSEGFTDYYTHRLALASGVWSPAQYAAAMTQVLRKYQSSPSRNATAATIASRFFSDQQVGRQMYVRGELLALRWDRALRNAGKAGLDPIMRSLVLPAERNLREGSLASERLLAALETTLADEPHRDVKTYVVEGTDIPLQPDLLGPCFQLTWTEVPRWVRGFDTVSYAAKRAIGVVPDGPAYSAGLRDGMALAGWAVNDGDITTPISITVRDGEVTRRIQYLPVDGSTDRLPTVGIAAKGLGSPECAAWLGRPG